MGEHEEWAQPSAAGLLPNGLLPDEAASVMRSLDSGRWSKAEERTAELIACIQPNPPSEEQRNAVASYVQRLVKQCFPCQVFTFGSVPLKTYLPDGDIDLTAFCKNQSLKETWAHQVRDILENEEKKENAEFRVKEVQYIQAEVKLIKCLVENIVVDISFNQLGGLCTLCFLEEVDHLINQNHLFKRSIILIKAWCYYESRILGAHHGLISTYALETLVLYIFHVFNNSFSGPLEVLYRFLEFFSKFDWENFCVSLWGPVPITSLPDVTAEPPRKDGGDLLLNKLFLDACSSVYAVFPGGQENQGQPFVSKHFNVIDPLRINNNLGRSVSKGNFFRIRSAFTFGAKRLARLLDCPKEDLFYEVNQFFMNTWDRHGNGQRPDAPRIDLSGPRLSNHNQSHGPQNTVVRSSTKSQISSARDGDEHSIQSQKNHRNVNNLKTSDQIKKETIQRSTKPDNNVVSDIQGRILFARTRSSPELSDAYGGKILPSVRLDSTRKTNLESDDSPSSRRSSSSRQSVKPSGDSRIGSNSYQDETGVSDEFATVSGAQGMHQEEQDLVNMMAASANHGFNGQIPVPLNLASHHLPLPISPSFLASMGYGQRNMGGMVNPWGPNVQFPPGVVPSQMAHCFPGMGLTQNPEDHHLEPPSENFGSVSNSRDADRDVWHDHDNGGLEILQADDKQQSTSSGYNFSPSSRGPSRGHAKLPKESDGDEFQYHENHFDDRTAPSRSRAGSMRSKTSSESSWEGSSKSKSTRDKRGLKSSPLPVPSTASTHGKDKSVSEHSSTQAEEDNRDWNLSSPIGADVAPHSDAMWLARHQITGYEPPQTSGSDSIIPFSSMVLNPNSRPRTGDNSGAHPFTFYATGPPVPFVTMLPVYNYPGDSGSSDASTSHFNSDEGADISNSGQNFDSSEGLVKKRPSISLEIMKEDASLEPSEHKPDILNSDFTSHYQNLQYGRLCQDVRYHPSPMVSPVMVHPGYLQGRSGQWDGTGRPLSNNMNIFTQIMGYGHRVLPVAPLQTIPNRPTGVYNRYVEEMPRYRSGTGTYLPNPKASVRDRQSTNTRRGNYSFDRNDHYGDREGNWNASPKLRPSGRGGYGRNDREKTNSRVERLNGGESRSERSWGPHRHDSFSQNGPVRSSSSTQSSSTNVNVPYGVYPVPSISNHGGASSNGPAMPSVVMLYPYDQSGSYGTPHPEQLEFGSLGAMGFSGPNEGLQQNEEQRFHSSSARQSSPDQPPASQIQR